MNLLRQFPGFMAIVVALTGAGVALAQTQPAAPDPNLKFEVATLKPTPAGARGGGIRPTPGGERYLANNVPLKAIIALVYRVKFNQVTGGPDWVNTERYDMNAKAEKPSSIDDLHTMLKNLLADEFKLQFHHEKKEMPVYALVVDKDGAKMTPHPSPNNGETAGETWITMMPNRTPGEFLKMNWHGTLVTMDYLAYRLGDMLDRPVLDLTDLKGGYDFDLAFTREPPPGMPDNALINGVPVDTSGPNIFEAIRKLGLRLDRQKGNVDTIVIDHAEKPSGN